MKKSVFRNESLDRVNSPEELNDYIKVTSPSVWIVLSAIVLLLVGFIVFACFAAIAGGGVFGDHCSPVSDTTILSSMGAGSDHIDHVKTQLPYALTVAGICAVAYLIGWTVMKSLVPKYSPVKVD